jgi:hypothetical protein
MCHGLGTVSGWRGPALQRSWRSGSWSSVGLSLRCLDRSVQTARSAALRGATDRAMAHQTAVNEPRNRFLCKQPCAAAPHGEAMSPAFTTPLWGAASWLLP